MEFLAGQPQSDEGVHVGAVARAVGGEAGKIRSGILVYLLGFYETHSWRSAALDVLMDEGLVYTTIDDSHFQVST